MADLSDGPVRGNLHDLDLAEVSVAAINLHDVPFPQAVMDAFYRATNEHHAELAARDAHFKKAYDSVNAFRKEQLGWLQIAEHSMDNFMLSLRGRA